MRHLLSAMIATVFIAALACPASAKVVKFEITRVESPAFEGRAFGTVGTYDRIIARATVAVSPDDPHNKIIVDLDRAPRDVQGLVEAVTDVEILRPTITANGNRRLFYEVLNRGGKLGLALFNDNPVVVNDLVKASDAGNGFLMNCVLHRGVERLAGRHRARRRTNDVLAAGCPGCHRPGARGVRVRADG